MAIENNREDVFPTSELGRGWGVTVLWRSIIESRHIRVLVRRVTNQVRGKFVIKRSQRCCGFIDRTVFGYIYIDAGEVVDMTEDFISAPCSGPGASLLRPRVDAALRLLSLDRCSIIRVCDANNSGHQEIQ